MLLDLTAAFDTVDHSVLISRLKHYVGLQGTALKWFSSYLSNRTFSVMFNDLSSTVAPLSLGVPQGSILGPILFSLYILPLGHIISSHDVSFHLYADDIQLYLPVVPNDTSAMDSLNRCLQDIKNWLAQSFLHLNVDKTEYIYFSRVSNPSPPIIGPFTPHFSDVVRNLGVLMDSQLHLEKQVNAVVRASFFQLRLLAKVKPFLSRADLEKAIHAFISSRLDYCTALYYGLNKSLLHRLQLVQNAAARLLSNTPRRAHITPVLHSLHWLPVEFRIEFKVLMFVFKAIYGLAPAYLSDLLTVRDPVRALRSSHYTSLVRPKKSNYEKWGDRSFAVCGPELWNALPKDLRNISELSVFKARLKTYLFR